MADYIRRLVSGDKVRFKDHSLNLELDLVYVTDQLIIMGYPASGMEGLYRNRREDVKKFLEHRHGQNFWVFNFCPIKENSYPASVFDGRVSRYPYPDHHVPPLAILPLVAREIRAWVNGSAERVAVLHCKAGKGRSGTLACSYLLSLDDHPVPPRLERSYNVKQWAEMRADRVAEVLDDTAEENTTLPVPVIPVDTADGALILHRNHTPSPDPLSQSSPASASVKSFEGSLKGVLDLHTSQRMKAPTPSSKKVKEGVTIPSQRRWLYYWSLLLAHRAPAHLWALSSFNGDSRAKPNPRVRLTEIKLRMKEVSAMKMQLVRAASLAIGRTNFGKQTARQNGSGHVWVSLARYDDELVKSLEKLEKYTREDDSGSGMKGRMRKGDVGVGALGNLDWGEMFNDGRWDNGKMVRTFGRLETRNSVISNEGDEQNSKIIIYTLRPLSDENWVDIRDEVQEDPQGADPSRAPFKANSMYEVTETGIMLDAGREVRVKLYMGQVLMGWFWFIPTFHMPHDPASTPMHLILTRKEIDFSVGIGGDIMDVDVSLEWLTESDSDTDTDIQSQPLQNYEPKGMLGTMQGIAGGGIGDAVERGPAGTLSSA